MSVKRSVFVISILISPNLYALEPVEQPLEETAELPIEEPAEETAELPIEDPAEEAVEPPAEDPAEEAVEPPAEEPAEEAVEPPAEEPVEQPVVEVLEESSIEDVVSPWTTVLPFGIPQFAQGESNRGWIYAGIQGVGLAASIYTGLEMRRLAVAGEIDQELTYRLISAGTVAVTAITWFVSVVDGSNMRIESIERTRAARDWERSQRSAIVLTVE